MKPGTIELVYTVPGDEERTNKRRAIVVCDARGRPACVVFRSDIPNKEYPADFLVALAADLKGRMADGGGQ